LQRQSWPQLCQYPHKQALKFKPQMKLSSNMAAAVVKVHLQANAATCRQARAQFTVIDKAPELLWGSLYIACLRAKQCTDTFSEDFFCPPHKRFSQNESTKNQLTPKRA
jgi:hypothetical protein